MIITGLLFAVLLYASFSDAKPVVSASTPVHQVFQSRNLADTKLRFVKDSGVCETTPGVHQISGYIDVGTNMSIVSSAALRSRNV